MRKMPSSLHALTLFTAALAGCSTTSTSSEPAGGPATTPAATTSPAPTGAPTGSPSTPVPVDPTTDPNAKPCTGAPGSLYELVAKQLTVGTDVPMCRFDGSVLLIVNVASHCGYTPQYEPLQKLYATYQARGLYVLGFPSQQFNQEFANQADITAFCGNYTAADGTPLKITFPMFATADVNGPAQQPVYTWLKAQPGQATDIAWNFEKFLVSRHGQVVKRVPSATSPDAAEVVAAIEAELAKP
jgi:glutathione peroxidase